MISLVVASYLCCLFRFIRFQHSFLVIVVMEIGEKERTIHHTNRSNLSTSVEVLTEKKEKVYDSHLRGPLLLTVQSLGNVHFRCLVPVCNKQRLSSFPLFSTNHYLLM